MRCKRWDIQFGDKLHTIEFQHGKMLKKHRKLLMDGQEVHPENWRVYMGKTPVTEFPFTIDGHTLTVVLHQVKRTLLTYDLLVDGVSVETGQRVDIGSLAQHKSKTEKLKEMLFYLAIFIVLRILAGVFLRGQQ